LQVAAADKTFCSRKSGKSSAHAYAKAVDRVRGQQSLLKRMAICS